MRRLVRAVLIALLAAGAASAQSPSAPPAAGVNDERFSTKQRHLVLLNSALRRLNAVAERVARGEPVDWPRITTWLASVAKLDRELRVREALLNIKSDGPFAVRIERAHAAIRARVASLQSPAPLLTDDAFNEPEPPPPVPAQAKTPGQLREKLKTTPVGSVQDLFGTTVGLKKATLPKKDVK